ncbi:RsmB/NOP family class I SAM-dependent RNA methyltransferase [Sphingobacterium sp. LRF_L2]|uniref:RsmB/NOP family class I SAM-dependent RNA methyltransferase n=1 Tax=Sphingobacterium sp. LRF_L2 TaxID=3369421 RepID=UPI003F5F035D
MLSDKTEIERVIIAEFLCECQSDLVALYHPEWIDLIPQNSTQKLDFLKMQGYDLNGRIFPFTDHVSKEVDVSAFENSHLVQPDLFIRIKEGAQELLEKELQKNEIDFQREGRNAYRLPNGSKLQTISSLEGLFEVQDLSSQESLDVGEFNKGTSWWDACAASGGKSLLLLEKNVQVNLFVSDIRLSILRNLDERFEKAGVKTPYRKKVLDLSQDISHIMKGETFDGIIVDAPCSGSGTWGRTPEMIQQFKSQQISVFSALQKKIVSTVLPFLNPKGQLIYITCSVFKEENEELVHFLETQHGLVKESGGFIEGYKRKSDSMYAVRLRKP